MKRFIQLVLLLVFITPCAKGRSHVASPNGKITIGVHATKGNAFERIYSFENPKGETMDLIVRAYNDGSNDYQIVKKYINLAAEMNWPYNLIDWKWNEMRNGGTVNDAVQYAGEKGIKTLLWYNSSTSWNGEGVPMHPRHCLSEQPCCPGQTKQSLFSKTGPKKGVSQLKRNPTCLISLSSWKWIGRLVVGL